MLYKVKENKNGRQNDQLTKTQFLHTSTHIFINMSLTSYNSSLGMNIQSNISSKKLHHPNSDYSLKTKKRNQKKGKSKNLKDNTESESNN